MRVRELIALLQTLPPEAAVSINRQEYHPTGKYEMWADGELQAVMLEVDLCFPRWFTDKIEAKYKR